LYVERHLLNDIVDRAKLLDVFFQYSVSDFVDWLEDRATEEIAKRPKDARGE